MGEVTQTQISGLSISDQPLQNTLSLGGKLGHFFTRARWIGIETGLFYTTPHIKEGSSCILGSRWVVNFANSCGRSPAHDYVG